jgi:CheY-like chemotaxis protein
VELETADASATDASTAGGPLDDQRVENSRRLKILLVEDHADTRRLMGRLLARSGHDIRTAGSVASALRVIYEKGPVELLVSDLSLPDGTGVDLFNRIRATHPTDPIKAIALSGHGMEQDLRQTREAGFARHLIKPVNMRVLEQAIQEVAGK